jgi:hypothetical protein
VRKLRTAAAVAALLTATNAWADGSWWHPTRSGDVDLPDICANDESPAKRYEDLKWAGHSPEILDDGGKVSVSYLWNGDWHLVLFYRKREDCEAYVAGNRQKMDAEKHGLDPYR